MLIYQNIGHIVLMLLLLGCSAFFSGAETAYFNLSRRQVNLLARSEHKLQKLVGKLLNKPRQLLDCLLLGNMVVNVLFYAAASIVVIRVEQQIGVAAAAVTAFIAFCILVLFGEILPKSIAYANSKHLSITAALPVFLCRTVFTPVVSVFRFLAVEPILRLFLGPSRGVEPITAAEFKLLIEQVRKHGLITTNENKLLSEVVELEYLKVRDCLQPRVDMVACEVTESNKRVRELMLKHQLTKLPVYVKKIDNIIGLIHLRQLLLKPDISLDRLVQHVHFVPEQKRVESLLEFFRQAHTDFAIVVDEYGGIAGSIRLEDIADELLGPIDLPKEIAPVEPIGPFEYRLAGNLSIYDWAEAFGIDPTETRLSTIGGLVTAILGRMPKAGDVAQVKNLKFTVERVHKRRIETLILTLEPLLTNDG